MTKRLRIHSRRGLALLSVLGLLLGTALIAPITYAQDVPELQVNSKRYIVVDADTGQVFAQKGAHDQVAIASLTKIFTAVLAIESAPLGRKITTDRTDVFGSSSTTMGFGAGETFTLEELLYGMMLPSGNDAAHAIARDVGGQPGDSSEQAVDRFMQRLNQRVLDMGLNDTHLVNPHGWGVPGHYSSAWDVAAFMMFALQYPTFVETMGTANYETSSGYYLSNTNKLLRSYDGMVGGKTGYDDDAGWCLVNVARRDGHTMIAVTLDGVAPDDWYDDNRVLLDYAFERKADLAADGAPVSGDRVSFRDPDAAVIARGAEGGAAFYAMSPGTVALGGDQQDAAAAPLDNEHGGPPALNQGQFWIAAGATLALLGVRGTAIYRGRRRDAAARPVDARSDRR